MLCALTPDFVAHEACPPGRERVLQFWRAMAPLHDPRPGDIAKGPLSRRKRRAPGLWRRGAAAPSGSRSKFGELYIAGRPANPDCRRLWTDKTKPRTCVRGRIVTKVVRGCAIRRQYQLKRHTSEVVAVCTNFSECKTSPMPRLPTGAPVAKLVFTKLAFS
jgi:hypothetical protein